MDRYCDWCRELVKVDEDRWLKCSTGSYVCDSCVLEEADLIRTNGGFADGLRPKVVEKPWGKEDIFATDRDWET